MKSKFRQNLLKKSSMVKLVSRNLNHACTFVCGSTINWSLPRWLSGVPLGSSPGCLVNSSADDRIVTRDSLIGSDRLGSIIPSIVGAVLGLFLRRMPVEL